MVDFMYIQSIFAAGTTASAADPQLQFFENFPGKDGAGFRDFSRNTLSIHAVNLPLSLSFGTPVVLIFQSSLTTARTVSVSFGLYSLNGSTLSLANSASGSNVHNNEPSETRWVSMVTSATQNISPGAWYFGINYDFSNNGVFSIFANSSVNPDNASPVFVRGRVTESTNAMPASIATSALDITGSDAMRQPYIIITA